MSEKTVFLLKRADLAPGMVCRVENGGCPLAVFNIDGRFYATSDRCTHADASLSEGEVVDGDQIACPVHNGQFHIPTGQATVFPCEVDLRTYRVIERDDGIFADLEQEAEEAASGV